jgi:hypothetical protein
VADLQCEGSAGELHFFAFFLFVFEGSANANDGYLQAPYSMSQRQGPSTPVTDKFPDAPL